MNQLKLTGRQKRRLMRHLLKSDGRESAALLITVPVQRDDQLVLLVKDIVEIDDADCRSRDIGEIIWPAQQYLAPLYPMLEAQRYSLILVHSHPCGLAAFSGKDDQTDHQILSRLDMHIEHELPHGSAVMVPGGDLIARLYFDGAFQPIETIRVTGDMIESQQPLADKRTHKSNHAMVYGNGTTDRLTQMRIAVVGCSGTGSPLIELLLRYHIGELILIDFDVIEDRNLERMQHARQCDADAKRLKVDRLKAWIKETGLPTKVRVIKAKVQDPIVADVLATCDVVFGCVDNILARHTLNKIACAYLLPYFDLGVTVRRHDKTGELMHALARCHYLQPDGACLLDREAYSAEQLAEENYREDDPEYYAELKRRGYTHDEEELQAVMTLTMQAAIMAMDDLMARLNNFRLDAVTEYDVQEHAFVHGYYRHSSYPDANQALSDYVASGDAWPQI